MVEQCRVCRFFIAVDHTGESRIGACRRFPPTTSPRVFDPPSAQLMESMFTPFLAAFPLVGLEDWCGEWKVVPSV